MMLEKLQRGDSFGEGELLAAAEAEEVSMAAKETISGDLASSTNVLSWSGRHASNERGAAARGGGVPRAVRAVCVSEACEIMAVPRHLFANLLDELGGVRRKLEVQVRSECFCVQGYGGGEKEGEGRGGLYVKEALAYVKGVPSVLG